MGFFSWKTSDTDRSIANTATGDEFPVTMICRLPIGMEWDRDRDFEGEEGQIPMPIHPDQFGQFLAFEEDAYEGYGRFGGVDYFAMIHFLNPEDDPIEYPQDCHLQAARERGIRLVSEAEKAAEKLGTTVMRKNPRTYGMEPKLTVAISDLLNVPKFVERRNADKYLGDAFYGLPDSPSCPDQGYFYQEIGIDEEGELYLERDAEDPDGNPPEYPPKY